MSVQFSLVTSLCTHALLPFSLLSLYRVIPYGRWRSVACCRYCCFSQEQICELYQSLYDSGEQDQIDRFEHLLVSVIKDVRKQQCENDRLERFYQRWEHAFILRN